MTQLRPSILRLVPSPSPVALAATALLVSLARGVALVVVPARESATLDSVWGLSGVIGVVGAVLPGVLLAAAIGVLLRRGRPDHRAAVAVSVVAGGIGVAFGAAAAASWGAGFDAADAGLPLDPFARAFMPLAIAGVVCIAVSLATAAYVVLPTRSRAGRFVIAVLVGAGGSVPVLGASVSPVTTAIASFVAVVGLVISASTGARRRASFSAPSVVRGRADRRRVSGLWMLGAVAITIVLVSWLVGAVVGISREGTDDATRAMGLAAAAAQLAAIPLIVAVSRIGSAQSPGSAWGPFAVVPIIGVSAAAALDIIAYAPDGVAVFVGAAIAGVSIGVWVAAGLAPRIPGRLVSRMLVLASIVVGTALVWLAVVVLSGGITLAFGGVALIVVSRGLLRRAAVAV